MKFVDESVLKDLHIPARESHKGQNGRLLIIGGSHLFHAASLWSLTVATRIVDLVHYSSVPENNEIVAKAKEEFRNGIVVPRGEVENYIEEDDCILIGPGMVRDGETKKITETLLKKYRHKRWVIDAGALQMMDLECIPEHAILTPHHKEFADLISKSQFTITNKENDEARVRSFAKQYQCVVLLKGAIDYVSDGEEIWKVEGGNSGMTKGGTGDVLAGLIAALACKNEPVLATAAGSFVNKKAGDELYKTVGPYFNASDLADQIPRTMKKLILS